MYSKITNPRVAADLVWRYLDDNAVVVSPSLGEVRVLNQVGTVIWQLLIEGQSVSEIENHLVANYDVNEKDAQDDLQKFFAELSERGVIVWEQSPLD